MSSCSTPHSCPPIVSMQDLLYVAYPGEFCGVMSALTGEASFITISAGADCHLVAITKTNLYQYVIPAAPPSMCALMIVLLLQLASCQSIQEQFVD